MSPRIGTATATAVDSDDSDDFFLMTSNYLTPTTLAMGTVQWTRSPEKLKQGPCLFFDATGPGRHPARGNVSAGRNPRFPYFQVARGKH